MKSYSYSPLFSSQFLFLYCCLIVQIYLGGVIDLFSKAQSHIFFVVVVFFVFGRYRVIVTSSIYEFLTSQQSNLQVWIRNHDNSKQKMSHVTVTVKKIIIIYIYTEGQHIFFSVQIRKRIEKKQMVLQQCIWRKLMT